MELTKTENRGRWQPGQSGNLNGKPPGARHRFSKAFLEDLAEVWAEHGRHTMLATIKQAPATFFAIAARLIPADVKVSIEQTFGGLSAEDYAVLQAIKQAVPNASSRSPSEVLEYVRDTLRAAEAKVIETVPADTAGIGA
jgi:hypothetical protein